MEWDDLRFVLALARKRSLSDAARALGVSHTTVGRKVRALEKRLRVRLFDHTPDAFVVTPAGQDLVEVAERLEAQVHALESRVLGRDEALSGELRVSSMDLLFQRHRAQLGGFVARYPDVALTVTISDDVVSLTRREADVALRLTNDPPEYLVGRKLGRIDFAVYASRKLIKRVGHTSGYEHFPWLGWDQRLNVRWLDQWLAKNAPAARVALRLNVNSVLLKQAVLDGLGVHFLACFDADAEPSLQRIGPVHREFSRDVWLLTLPELRQTSRVRAFMNHFDPRAQ